VLLIRSQRSASPNARQAYPDLPVIGEVLSEILPLVFFVPVAGPPVIVLLGPWVLFTLMLIGPFLLLVTFLLAAVILVAVMAAALAPLYILVRFLRRRRIRQPEPPVPVHRVGEPHVVGAARASHA
jgi:hypothetical protein